GALERRNRPARLLARWRGQVHDGKPNARFGLQVHLGDVDVLVGQHLVEPRDHARAITVYMDEAARSAGRSHRDVRQVDAAAYRPGPDVVAQLLGHFDAEVGLRFDGRAADMRREDHVVARLQGRFEGIPGRLGLNREDVDRGAAQPPGIERFAERLDVDDPAPGEVDQHRTVLHQREPPGADQLFGVGALRHMEGDDVGFGEQFVERAGRPGVAQRQTGDHIVEDDAHADGLGEQAGLRADLAVADDAERLAANFVGAGRVLQPAATAGRLVALGYPAHQRDCVGDDEFGDRARIRERSVEHRDAMVARGIEVDVVGAGAIGADRLEAWRALEELAVYLGARANSEDLDIGQQGREPLQLTGLVHAFDPHPGQGLEDRVGAGMDLFEQES